MTKRPLAFLVTLAALAAAPAAAGAADISVVPGADARQMTALDGTLVWVSGKFPNHTLMQRSPDGIITPVAGAPRATYLSIDLGHDGAGKLVLTYLRCSGTRNCKAYSDDLAGHRVTYKRLAPRRCTLTAAPARWGSRVAYGLGCTKLRGKPRVHDLKRSGLFVRTGTGAPKRLRLPKPATRFVIDNVRWVDLHGARVGAVVSDIYSYAFSQTVDGTRLRSSFVAASEGESDESVRGLSLGTGGALWTLVDAAHTGDPNQARISKLGASGCSASEVLANPSAADEGYRAEALAVDGDTIYLYAPSSGIVTHDFNPSSTCR
ncbi:MAG: hypothetical protein QOJ63_100 [Solirubrobacteraceae bacterium]|nr:hypothetical protein [Solirubrobacteraceae bacterium]